MSPTAHQRRVFELMYLVLISVVFVHRDVSAQVIGFQCADPYPINSIVYHEPSNTLAVSCAESQVYWVQNPAATLTVQGSILCSLGTFDDNSIDEAGNIVITCLGNTETYGGTYFGSIAQPYSITRVVGQGVCRHDYYADNPSAIYRIAPALIDTVNKRYIMPCFGSTSVSGVLWNGVGSYGDKNELDGIYISSTNYSTGSIVIPLAAQYSNNRHVSSVLINNETPNFLFAVGAKATLMRYRNSSNNYAVRDTRAAPNYAMIVQSISVVPCNNNIETAVHTTEDTWGLVFYCTYTVSQNSVSELLYRIPSPTVSTFTDSNTAILISDGSSFTCSNFGALAFDRVYSVLYITCLTPGGVYYFTSTSQSQPTMLLTSVQCPQANYITIGRQRGFVVCNNGVNSGSVVRTFTNPLYVPFSSSQPPFSSSSQTPFSSSQTPFSSSQTPFSSSQTPFSSSQTPFSSSQTPFSSSQTPFSSSQTPYSSSQTLFSSSQTPFSSSQTPFSSSQTPFSSSATPFSSSASPTIDPANAFPDDPFVSTPLTWIELTSGATIVDSHTISKTVRLDTWNGAVMSTVGCVLSTATKGCYFNFTTSTPVNNQGDGYLLSFTTNPNNRDSPWKYGIYLTANTATPLAYDNGVTGGVVSGSAVVRSQNSVFTVVMINSTLKYFIDRQLFYTASVYTGEASIPFMTYYIVTRFHQVGSIENINMGYIGSTGVMRQMYPTSVFESDPTAYNDVGTDVIIVCGQSNAVGLSEQISHSVPSSFDNRLFGAAFSGNTFTGLVALTDPMRGASSVVNTVGFAVTFARHYVQTIGSNRNVVVINTAVTGTGFSNGEWGDSYAYTRTVNAASRGINLMNYLNGLPNTTNRVVAFLWQQGEADAGDGGVRAPSVYADDVRKLAGVLRTGIPNAESAMWLSGQLVPSWVEQSDAARGGSDAAQIQQAIANVNSYVPRSATVSSSGLSVHFQSDIGSGNLCCSVYTQLFMHFNSFSYVELGYRYYQTLVSLRYNLTFADSSSAIAAPVSSSQTPYSSSLTPYSSSQTPYSSSETPHSSSTTAYSSSTTPFSSSATPTTADPTTAAPTTADPTTAAPTTAAPTTADPTTAAPTTASPTTASPTTATPTTATPTTAAPTTAAPTTATPTTATPTTATPTTATPTTADPTTATPTTATPTTADPTTATPTTASPTTNNPTTFTPGTTSPQQTIAASFKLRTTDAFSTAVSSTDAVMVEAGKTTVVSAIEESTSIDPQRIFNVTFVNSDNSMSVQRVSSKFKVMDLYAFYVLVLFDIKPASSNTLQKTPLEVLLELHTQSQNASSVFSTSLSSLGELSSAYGVRFVAAKDADAVEHSDSSSTDNTMLYIIVAAVGFVVVVVAVVLFVYCKHRSSSAREFTQAVDSSGFAKVKYFTMNKL